MAATSMLLFSRKEEVFNEFGLSSLCKLLQYLASRKAEEVADGNTKTKTIDRK
jgi:hypothetical protein